MIPEFHRVLIFLLLRGLLVPSFSSFGYYFLIDVVKVSLKTYAQLSIITALCSIIGGLLYYSWFMEYEIRSMMIINLGVGLICAPFT